MINSNFQIRIYNLYQQQLHKMKTQSKNKKQQWIANGKLADSLKYIREQIIKIIQFCPKQFQFAKHSDLHFSDPRIQNILSTFAITFFDYYRYILETYFIQLSEYQKLELITQTYQQQLRNRIKVQQHFKYYAENAHQKLTELQELKSSKQILQNQLVNEIKKSKKRECELLEKLSQLENDQCKACKFAKYNKNIIKSQELPSIKKKNNNIQTEVEKNKLIASHQVLYQEFLNCKMPCLLERLSSLQNGYNNRPISKSQVPTRENSLNNLKGEIEKNMKSNEKKKNIKRNMKSQFSIVKR